MSTRSRLGMAGAGLVAIAALAAGGSATAGGKIGWKGAESFTPVSLGPNVERCGPLPTNIEARFAGNGVDTEGGAYSVTASGCMNTETFRVTGLAAQDTFLATGDKVNIATSDFTMSFDPQTCVLTNAKPVPFHVAGGTGALSGASGRGTFDMTMNWPPCNGLTLPAYVWFKGELRRLR